jgi:pSer/pThr/pTyr-binding forkhead associated (FHA) protein
MWARLIHHPVPSGHPPDRDSDPGTDPSGELAQGPARLRLLLRDEWLNELAIAVDGPRFVIGRGRHCDLRSRSALVSRMHAALERRGDRVFVRDLETKNGTLLNGRLLRSAEAELSDGDRIQVGPVVLTLRFSS